MMLSADQRAKPRKTLLAFCKVRTFGGPWIDTVLRDLSSEGFRMAWNPRYRVGTKLTLNFANLENMLAEVRWRTEREIGCQLLRPLSDYVFDHIVASHSVEVEQHRPQKDRLRSYCV